MKRIVIFCLILGLLACVYYSQKRVIFIRQNQLHISAKEKLENIPPIVAFSTMVLGGFRSLFVNLLWLRAIDLQEQEKFFEMMQLSDLIAKLQPKSASTWKFQVWNIAYNIAEQFDEPKDRYRWIKKAISLLRDQGIAYNPTSYELYEELGLLFELKLTLNNKDAAHMYYKQAWAEEMMQVFGGERFNYDEFKRAPKSFSELVKDTRVKALIEAFKKKGVDIVKIYFTNSTLIAQSTDLIKQYPNAFYKLSLYLRRKRLEQEYKMDIDYMHQLDLLYGPLDWRLTFSHGIYWAAKALDYTKDHKNMHCARVLYQSLHLGMYNGRLKIIAGGGFFLVPDFHLIDRLLKLYLNLETIYGAEAIRPPFRYFMEDATEMLYLYQKYDEAANMFALLKSKYPSAKYDKDLEQFLFEKKLKELGSNKQASDFLNYMIDKGFWWYALDEKKYATGFFLFSKLIYNKYKYSISFSFDELVQKIYDKKLNENLPPIVKKRLADIDIKRLTEALI